MIWLEIQVPKKVRGGCSKGDWTLWIVMMGAERERERERGCAFLLLFQAGTQETAANNTPLTPLHRASSRHVLPSKIMGIASIWLLALQVPCKQFLFFLSVDWRPLRRLQVIPSLFFLASLGKWKQKLTCL
jgi:hypothetical protein